MYFLTATVYTHEKKVGPDFAYKINFKTGEDRRFRGILREPRQEELTRRRFRHFVRPEVQDGRGPGSPFVREQDAWGRASWDKSSYPSVRSLLLQM